MEREHGNASFLSEMALVSEVLYAQSKRAMLRDLWRSQGGRVFSYVRDTPVQGCLSGGVAAVDEIPLYLISPHAPPSPHITQVPHITRPRSYATLRQLGQDQWLQRHPEAGSSWPSWPHTTAEAARATRLATMMWSGSTDWRIGKQGCAVAHESAWYSFDICGWGS